MANRREFIGGATALVAFGGAGQINAAAQSGPFQEALHAIGNYADAHRIYFNLPAITLSVIAPGGFSTVINRGFADPATRRPIGPATLFQIGSITKCMTAAVLHQLAAEGKVRLDKDAREFLPETSLPDGVPITVQQLIDHTSGLPGNAPTFPSNGRLWVGFKPGMHWSYSNTAYMMLGMMAERIERKSLARIFHERLFAPLKMRDTFGAIDGAQRDRYAIGYTPADPAGTFVRGGAIMPASWVNMTGGSGSVASTAADMALFMQSLADAAAGRGGLGLSPAAGLAFAGHDVPGAAPGIRYGNGLMKRTTNGQPFLAHTGGMVSFSSSFNVDSAGYGAFASSSIGFPVDYRPRLLTLYAAEALRSAREGRPLLSPPPLETKIENADDFVGLYGSGTNAFEIRGGPGLTIVADGVATALQMLDDDVFGSAHPRLSSWPVRVMREDKSVVAVGWGPDTFAREGTKATLTPSDPALARFAGRYISDSPWEGVLHIVERGGQLWLGGAYPLHALSDGSWRSGEKEWSPERVRFANAINGRPQTMLFSGAPYQRQDI